MPQTLQGGLALLVSCLALDCLPVPAVNGSAEPKALTYTESSPAAGQPTFEAGNSEVEMGDLNGDGNVDLISLGDHGNPLIQSTEEGILIWLGNGQGGWTYVHAGSLGYGGVAIGDLNGDGLMDAAYGIHHNYGSADFGDQLIEAVLGDGSAMNWLPWDDGLAVHGQTYGMFSTDLADAEGDGDLDLAGASFGSGQGLHLYINRGDGAWDRSFGFLGGNTSNALYFGDVNGDGAPDLAAAKEEGTIWINDGEGFLTQGDNGLPALPEFEWRPGVSLGDVDGDGKDDLAFCNAEANAEVWFSRPGPIWVKSSTGLPTDAKCEYTQLHDMDVDGTTDLITFGHRRVRVMRWNSVSESWAIASGFNTPDLPGSGSAFRVGGDIDHNGFPDIVVLDEARKSAYETINTLRVFREGSTPSAPNIHIVQPGPNRKVRAGGVTFLDWVAAVPSGEEGRITLELSLHGAAGPWEPIAQDLPNNGRYQWTVPPRQTTEVRVRATLTLTNEQVSSIGPGFEISRKPDSLDLRFSGHHTLEWTDALLRPRYNLYRGDWDRFRLTGEYTQNPTDVPAAARYCDLITAGVEDPYLPSPGTMVFYLVTGYRMVEDGQTQGVLVPMAESTLGQTGRAVTRVHAAPCPKPSVTE